MEHSVSYNSALHRTAQLTVAGTLLLIFLGGLVTSHGAGMSVPDWPNSYGYNMFTFPISQWRGGIIFEHSHRLMGSAIGFCSILLVLMAWAPGRRPTVRKWLWIATAFAAGLAGLLALTRLVSPADTRAGELIRHALAQASVGLLGLSLVLGSAALTRHAEPRRWVRWLCAAVLVAVILQGILGGLRVVLVKLDLAVVHACVAQAFLCLAALASVVTSRWWLSQPIEPAAAGVSTGRGMIRLAAVCVMAIYLQLIVGALMRHYQAGLAVPDFPLHYGQLLPPTDEASLALANAQRIEMKLPPTTLWDIWLHMSHRLGALAVTAIVVFTAMVVLRSRPAHRALRSPAWALLGLLIVQITLGILTILRQKPADIASLHVVVGAITLMTSFVLLLRSIRLYGTRRAAFGLDPQLRLVPA